MAKADCQFFPGSPASWQCTRCQTFYGEQCIPDGHSALWGRAGPRCIRCDAALKFLGTATDAKPFWQQLPHFLAYPLHRNAVMVMALVALLSLMLNMGLLSLLVLLLIGAVVIKYGFAIIERRGEGKTEPPTLSEAVGGDEDHLFLRHMALLIAMSAITVFAARIAAPLGLLASVFLTLALPAATMLLAVEKSVRHALNPLAQLSLMLTVGWPYLLLWFCTQIIAAGPYYATSAFATALGGAFLLPAMAVFTVYFTLVLYTMLGYVLFEYQHELGYQTAPEGGEEPDEREFTKARALGESAVLLSDGDYQGARRCLRTALDKVRDDIELHLQYHKLLMLLEDDESLRNHSNYLLDLMARQNATARGVSVLLDTQRRLPGFRLEKPETAVALARTLWEQGQYRALVRLLQNFHKAHPGHPAVPRAYLLVARAFGDPLNDENKALAIARYVIRQFPRCPERGEFDQLARVLSSDPAGR